MISLPLRSLHETVVEGCKIDIGRKNYVLVTQGNKMVESVTLLKENQGFVPKTKNSRKLQILCTYHSQINAT